MTPKAMGLVWYRKEDYARLKSIFEDGDKLAVTYEDWLAPAEKFTRLVEAQGIRVIKAEVDPNTFPEWCAANGVDVDANGRSAFANYIAMQAAKDQSGN